MPIADAYQNASLDGLVASWTAGTRWALFDDDPTNGGLELTGAGYVAPAFATSDFAAAVDASKDVAAPIAFGTSTAAWDQVGTYWAILDSTGGVVYFDDLGESQVVLVDDAGVAVTISPSVFFAVSVL